MEAAAAVVRPLLGFVLCVGEDSFQREGPVDGGAEVLDVGVYEDDVGVGAALGPALTHGHVAVGEPAFVGVRI